MGQGDWLDIWVGHRRYPYWIQDALPGMEIHLLHALKACFQRIGPYQPFGSLTPGSPVGSRFGRNFLQPPLPALVWVRRWPSQMAAEIGLHKHYCVPIHIPASHSLLLFACHLPFDWEIHHSNSFFIQLSNVASMLFLALFISIILTSVLELRWSGVSIEDWWRNEQFWVIGGVSAHLFAVFQGFLKILAGVDTNFTVTTKASDDADFGELYLFKWTTLLIPPTSLLIVNLIGVVAGFSDALNSGYEAWGPLFGKVFFSLWVILHLYPFLKGLMGRQNRTPTIVVLWSVMLASVFSLLWVKIDPFLSKTDSSSGFQGCSSMDC